MQEAKEKADILVQAIKYIKRFSGKIVVVKYGGNAMEDSELKDSVFEDISMLARLGLKIVVVHGGGPAVDVEVKKQGLKVERINGLRITDEKTLLIIEKVFAGVNLECVEYLQNHEAKAKDCTEGTIMTEIKNKKLGLVGDVTGVDVSLIKNTLSEGIIPVISCLGRASGGQLTNINADTAAAKVAEALGAEKLTVLTNVDAVMDESGQRISHIDAERAEQYIKSGVINGGMIPKVEACIDAAEHGVKKAHLLNGMTPRALLVEIFTDQGIGTEVVRS